MTLTETHQQLIKEIENLEINKSRSEEDYYEYAHGRGIKLSASLSQFIKDCKEQLEFLEQVREVRGYSKTYLAKKIDIKIEELKQILEKNEK